MPRPSEVLRKPTDEASEGMLGAVVDTLDLVKTAVDAQGNFGEVKVDAARSYMSGTGVQTAALASNLRAILTNPAGSGKYLYVYGFTAQSTVAATLTLRINPTTGVPTTARTPTNKLIGGPAASATMFADLSTTTPLGGGSLSSSELMLPPNNPRIVELDHPLRIGAGVTLGIAVPLSAAGSVNVNVSWWEDPV